MYIMPEINKNKIKNTISKCIQHFHVDYIQPSRCVFIRMKECYICGKTTKKDTIIKYIDNYQKNHLVGYISCDKCKSIIKILYKIYEENGLYIPNKLYNNFSSKNFKFYRVSSNKNIKPYIQLNASLNLTNHEIFRKDTNNRLVSLINWHNNNILTINNELMKTITLANIIYNNRKLFGYRLKDGPLIQCAQFWHTLINREYIIASKFKIFLKCLCHKKIHINYDVQKIIEELWLGELL